MPSALDELTGPQLDDPKRRFGTSMFEAAAETPAPSRQQNRMNRLKAADLAERGIPTFRNASGDVAPITDDTGTALNALDTRHNVAYDSKGQPKQISYDETGPPVLSDPFAKLPSRVNAETGAIEKTGAGGLYQYQGQDPAVTARLAQKERDKELAAKSTLLGRKLTLDEHDLMTGNKDLDESRDKLIEQVSVLGTKQYEGADLPTVMKGIDEHFNAQYAAPEANNTRGWFGKELAPEATARRQQIDAAKAKAIADAEGHFALKDKLSGLDDTVAATRATERANTETLLAHAEGKTGPLDAAKASNEAGPIGAKGLYPPEEEWSRMLGGEKAVEDVHTQVSEGRVPPIAAAASVAATHDIKDAQAKAEQLKTSDPTTAEKYANFATTMLQGLSSGITEITKGMAAKPSWSMLIDPLRQAGAMGIAAESLVTGKSQDEIRARITGSAEDVNKSMTKLVDERLKDSIGTKAGHFVGGIAPFVGVALATKGKSIATPLMANLFYTSGFQRTYEDAIAHGASENHAQAAGVGVGAINAVLALPLRTVGKAAEAIFGDTAPKVIERAITNAYEHGGGEGVYRILYSLAQQIKAGGLGSLAKSEVHEALTGLMKEITKPAAQRVADVAKAALSHAAIGAGVQTASNLVAKTYDPERGTFEGVAEQAIGFGLLGTVSKGFEQVAAARKAKQALDLINKSGSPPPGAPPALGGPPPEPKPPKGPSDASVPKQRSDTQIQPEGGEPAATGPSAPKPVDAKVTGSQPLNADAKGPATKADVLAAEAQFVKEGGHADKLDAQNKLTALREAFPDPTARMKAIQERLSPASNEAEPKASNEAAPATVDEAAHAAATSPKNELVEPTQAQVAAGNHQMGHVNIGGLDLTLQHPEGTSRKPGFEPLTAHYSYIKGTVGADKMHIDVFVQPKTPTDYNGPVFVVNQYKKDGSFDEHKSLIGPRTEADAKALYSANYPKEWTGGKSVVKFDSPAQFKAWATGGPKGPAIQPIKIVAPEGGSLHASQIEAPHIVSTAVKQNGRYLVGSKWNEPHSGVGIRHGVEDVAQGDRGFIVQDAAGNRTFATRAQAEPIAQKAGQVKGVIGDNGLQSEHLQVLTIAKSEEKNATTPGKQQSSEKGELPRVPSGIDVRPHEGEIRQEAGGQAGGGSRAVERAASSEGTGAEPASDAPSVAAEQISQITAGASERKAAERLANAPETSPAKLKVQKAFLLDALDKAVADAPKEDSFTADQTNALRDARNIGPAPVETAYTFSEKQRAMEAAWAKVKATVPMVEIDVPGDGTFTIVNSKEALQTFRDLAKKKFPTVAAKPPSGGGNLRATESKITPLGKPKTAGDFIKIASLAATIDETRPVLANVRSDGKTVVAIDGRRLLMIDAKAGGTTEKPVFFDRNLKVVKEPGQYPNFRQVIPLYTKANEVATIDTGAMQKLLAQAMEMTSDKSNSVKLWRDKSGAVGVTSQTPEVGEFAGGSDPATSNFLAAYHPQFLMDAMKAARALGHEQVTLSLDKKQPEMSPALITAPGMTYVLIPMREANTAASEAAAARHPLATPTKANIGGAEPTKASNEALLPTKDRAVQLLEGVLDNKFPQWRTTPKADLPEQAQKLIGQLTKQLTRKENDRPGKRSETTGTLKPTDEPTAASIEGRTGEREDDFGSETHPAVRSESDTGRADVANNRPDRTVRRNEADGGAVEGTGLDRGGENRPMADTDTNRPNETGVGARSIEAYPGADNQEAAVGSIAGNERPGERGEGDRSNTEPGTGVASTSDVAQVGGNRDKPSPKLGIDDLRARVAGGIQRNEGALQRMETKLVEGERAEHGLAFDALTNEIVVNYEALSRKVNHPSVTDRGGYSDAAVDEETAHAAHFHVDPNWAVNSARQLWKAGEETSDLVADLYGRKNIKNAYLAGMEYIRMLAMVRGGRSLPESFYQDVTNVELALRKPQATVVEETVSKMLRVLGWGDGNELGVVPLNGPKASDEAPDIAHMGGPAEAIKALKKKLVPGLETLNDIKEGVQSLLLPSAQTPAHLRAAELLGSKLGPMHRRQEASRAAFKKDWLTFEKLGVHREDVPLSKNPGIQFMSDIMQAKVIDPKLQSIASRVQGAFSARVTLLEKADAPLETVREHYFPGMWTRESREAFNAAVEEAMTAGIIGEDFNPNDATADQQSWIKDRADKLLEDGVGSQKDALQFLTKRPLKGRESFRKQKVFDDIMTGVKFGLRPISGNPVDLVMLKLAEMDKSIMANEVFQALKAKGQLKTIKPAEKVPDGWAKVQDKYGTIYGPPPASNEAEPGKMEAKTPYVGLPILGYRIVPEPVADILNNYLSSSLYNNRYFGTLFTGWMGLANALNQTQLGVGSAFHAGFTTMEAQISGGANVVKDVYGLLRGNRSFNDLLKTTGHLFTASVETGLTGDKILNAWRKPDGVIDERIAQVVRAAELAGAGFKLETGLQTDQTSKFVSDWLNGHRLRAARRSPVAFVEMLAKPIMEWIVPRQKAGVFAHLAWRIIEQNPGKSLEELTPEFRQAWNRVDARLGQVRYDRLFINNTAKNVVQGLVRAPGWSGGTIAELGGAFKDTYSFFEEFAKTGKLPKDVPDRVAYAISLLVTVTLLNAVLTWALTGDNPEGLDYWAFRTGGKDEHGNPERFVLPTYVKDIIAYVKEPWVTLLNKSHPLLSIFGDLFRNKTFYSVEIRDSDSNALMQGLQSGKYVAKSFIPFWIRGAQKELNQAGLSAKALLPLIGVMPAPRKLTQTPAQELAAKINGAAFSAAPISERQAERRQEKSDITSKIRRGESPDIAGALARGTIKPADVSALYKRATMAPIASQVDHMTLENAERVFQRASLKEREVLAPIMARKRKNSALHGRKAFTGF